ncbi:MAG: hypothetical protein J1E29_04740 [Duncaniella sp.]|nr:hypothetical protein [Duncaniella sp.]
MKKIFTLFAVAALALSAKAADVYSWASNGGEVTEVGGTITYENGVDPNRVNYPNTANGVEYHTICLNGKKGNLGETPASANAGYMKLVLNEALQAGDKLEINAYINKDAESKGSAYVAFIDAAGATVADIAEDESYPNANEAFGEQPAVHALEVPAAAVGVNTIYMSRNLASTNVFIVTLKVTREGGDEPEDPNAALNNIAAEANAPVVYYNLQGVRVENPANGLYIRKQGNTVTKVVL